MKSTELNRRQKIFNFYVDGIALIMLGLFLMIVGLDLTVYEFKNIVLSAILLFTGLAMMINAFIQHNSLLLWIGTLIFVCSTVGFIAEGLDNLGYAELYPIYIAAPAAASLVALILTKDIKIHIVISLFFGIISIIFSFHSTGILPIETVLPMVLMVIGIMILIFTIFTKGEKHER